MIVTVNIKYYYGWDTKNIIQIEENLLVDKYLYKEDGIFIYLKEPQMFSCGCGNTLLSTVYFLNYDGFVQYYKYRDIPILEEMCLHNQLNNLDTFLDQFEKLEWSINKVQWNNFDISNTENPIVEKE